MQTPAATGSGTAVTVGAVLLGWMFAGMEMALMVPTARPAIQDFVRTGALWAEHGSVEAVADRWFSWFLVAFLLGAAAGGVGFGMLGDRVGRVKAMGWSILCYSGWTGLSYGAGSPEALWVLRFAACLGIGGMWPTGVSLASEAWRGASKSVLAGLIGASANVGFLILGVLMLYFPVTRESWRWVLLVGACPMVVGIWVLLGVKESAEWRQANAGGSGARGSPLREVLRAPYGARVALGVALGTVPLLGGWASGQRLVPWAGQVGDATGDPGLRAMTQMCLAAGAVGGSLFGGWFAALLGRRLSYFLISTGALGLSAVLFVGLRPGQPGFLPAAFALGVAGTSFFGWLPYFLPDLFPTRIRATGTGIAFNFGRVFSAVAVLASAWLSEAFHGDIAKMGAATSAVYAAGMVLAWLIPKGGEDRGGAVVMEPPAGPTRC